MHRFINGTSAWRVESYLDQAVFVEFGELIPRGMLSIYQLYNQQ
jgi:hypothetical protein